ncbi:hypothetical protein T484DRAFT_1782287 [Baffinella frigidus]|nr:hypothetical protein T484DRAFT_1782287 [Cryptophyta sp. CCMP2293]
MAAGPGPIAAATALVWWCRSFAHYWLFGGSFATAPALPLACGDRGGAKAALYLAACTPYLWSRPHYRASSYREDLRNNLQNVALPGTGIALSVLCLHNLLACAALILLPPLAAFVGALRRKAATGGREDGPGAEREGRGGAGRGGGGLAALHESITGEEGYALEDKLVFLERAEAQGLPVTPWLKEPALFVCKRRDTEGGLGYQALSNAAHGGDWVVQAPVENSKAVAALLPDRAPLSTLRVVTAATPLHAGTRGSEQGKTGGGSAKVLSCVWRAGRAGKKTDHFSVLFGVDLLTGVLTGAATTEHWYHVKRPFFGSSPPGEKRP